MLKFGVEYSSKPCRGKYGITKYLRNSISNNSISPEWIVKWFHALPYISNYSVICLHTVKLSNSSVPINSIWHKSFVCIVEISNSSLWPINITMSEATTPGYCGLGSDVSEGVFHIPQSFSLSGDSLSDCFVISRTLVGGGTRLQRSNWCILQPSRLVRAYFQSAVSNVW